MNENDLANLAAVALTGCAIALLFCVGPFVAVTIDHYLKRYRKWLERNSNGD